MSTPEERREMFLDAQEQTAEYNRDQRTEERAGWDGHYDVDDRPSKAELAEMAYWDRIADARDSR